MAKKVKSVFVDPSRHTPGPWKIIQEGNNLHVRGPSRWDWICSLEFHQFTLEEAKNNAALIVHSPELLEALKQAVSACPCSIGERLSGHKSDCPAPGWIGLIAKTQGVEG